MEERNLLRIAQHLKTEEAQRRVQRNIQRGRNEVTVTIGRAARLFGFSESQLRDWEKSGLITPLRPTEGSKASVVTGQRQYSFAELDKLAIIRELLDEARLTPGVIPANIAEIWNTIVLNEQGRTSPEGPAPEVKGEEHLNKRINELYQYKAGWQFYASRVLWLALHLIYEEVPGFQAGLILPQQSIHAFDISNDASSIEQIGEALVGWLNQTGTFFTFLTQAPVFEYPSDYIVQPLSQTSVDNRTLVVVQREEMQHINHSEKAVLTVQRLLEPIYAQRERWRYYVGEGMQDQLDPDMRFTPKSLDAILTSLANITIQLGGQNTDGTARWHSCCVLLPNQTRLPHQQQSLTVRARSDQARYAVGITTLTPERHSNSLSLRAYQSGHIIYRNEQAREDFTGAARGIEEPVQANIAIPLGSAMGQPQGVLYINADTEHVFLESDQRVLRVMTTIIEELLSIYQTRQRLSSHIVDILEDPGTVDPIFKEFAAENDLLQDINTLLEEINRDSYQAARKEQEEQISFIGIDIDSSVQETILNSYGDETLHHLNKAVGLRIRDLLPALFTNYHNCKLYHIYAGRYYLFLRGFALEKTKSNAERLRKALEGSIAIQQVDLPRGVLTLPDISVHAGVTWYSYEKLKDFLDPGHRRSFADISSTIYHSLDFVLKLGTGTRGGNIVYAWDPGIQTFAPYQPEEEKK